jgi:hypothetical protein
MLELGHSAEVLGIAPSKEAWPLPTHRPHVWAQERPGEVCCLWQDGLYQKGSRVIFEKMSFEPWLALPPETASSRPSPVPVVA